ncbi:MAG: sigma 54-interacting transcriptional regulator [Tissierellaceae bacterium]|nr:sigma 54-interacting transcriptional regulator [Tissierellaceae bacterium]
MKYSIGLITENKAVIPQYIDQLESVFGESISIQSYNMEDETAYKKKNETLFLVSAHTAKNYKEVENNLPKNAIIIPIELSFCTQDILQLKTYPKGTQAIFVNVSKRMAEECIVSLYQMGVNHMELVPYYPGCEYPQNIKFAITPGESHLTPLEIKKLVDIGHRQISSNTMAELALKIGKRSILSSFSFLNYSRNQYNISNSLSTVVSNYDTLFQTFSSLLTFWDKPVIVLDDNFKIFDCNQLAIQTLNEKKNELIGKSLTIPYLSNAVERSRKLETSIQVNFVNKDNITIHADIKPIMRGSRFLGSLILMRTYSKEILNNNIKNGYNARYQFTDIIGKSQSIENAKNLAKKMARTESSVLITGESGTGKELFAHSIHNSSNRKNGPFVAINCAALPENLLESELFGYSDGAFTGAKRGGKKGLLELANGGTVFFDEIEGMSLSLQLKLLRVIQEREIMPVGGNHIVPIDIRIISASNQNLLDLIEEGKFRTDLYYRIGTLPLDLPPLRERDNDILLLIEEFKSMLNVDFEITPGSRKKIKQYKWPGNIRELRNMVEYLSFFDEEIIDEHLLPVAIRKQKINVEIVTEEKDIEFYILKNLYKMPCGRGRLLGLLLKEGISITETQLRKKLEILKDDGLINSGSGRTGSSITEKGIKEYKNRIK